MVLILSIGIVIICGRLNGDVWTFDNGYGRSFLLYIGGTLGGTMGVYALSKLFDNKLSPLVKTLAIGNIVTLGFHQIFINLIRMHLPAMSYLSYLLAFAILLAFYPIIRCCQSWCPILLGNYRPTK
jgi:hypothetical protein